MMATDGIVPEPGAGMSARGWAWPFGRKRWRKPVLIGASAALHIVVLGLLVLNGVGGRMTVVPNPPTVLYVEIEPRPLLANERPRPALRPTAAQPTSPADARPSVLGFRLPFGRERDEDETLPSTPIAGSPAPPPGAEAWQVQPETMADRVARGLRARGLGCANPDLLSRDDRALCETRFGEQSADASPVSGTGSPERDARFARQGARELAGYDERREVRASERATCAKSGPVGDCGVEVTVDLFSSIHGFLPNQRRED
jgi:hypothetical protein